MGRGDSEDSAMLSSAREVSSNALVVRAGRTGHVLSPVQSGELAGMGTGVALSHMAASSL